MSFSGLESCFAATRGDIRTANDALVLFIHWKLTQEGVLCVGAGDDKSRPGSELLPNNWNGQESVYTLNYSDSNSNNYILKVIVSDDSAICNLIRCKDNKTTDVTLVTKQYIEDDLSNYSTVYKNKDELLYKVDQVVKAVVDSKGSDKPQPGLNISQKEYNPLREEPRRPRADAGPPGWDPLQGPPRIGGADLDPLGRGLGGGMIMDPFHPGRPMDPRWDPVGPRAPMGGGPQFPGRGGHPDDPDDPFGGLGGGGGRRNFGDAMRPPGWDNMFM